MKPRSMNPLPWPVNSEMSRYMREMQRINKAKSRTNGNEAWMHEKLKATGFKWSRQSTWGCRIFDFWCHKLGIAVEVDGPEHRIEYDNYRDEYNYRRSGILVLRVPNRDEEIAAIVLKTISEAETWEQRKARLRINGKTKRERRRLVR